MGSEEHNTPIINKSLEILNDSEEEPKEEINKKEKEISMSHRNLIKIDSLAMGEQYHGDIKEGKRNGKGIDKYKNGDRYEGLFKDGKKNGEGTFIYANGGKFKGEFKDDEKHGKGEYKTPSGQLRNEIWENGQLKNNNEKEFNENDSVILQIENDTKKFDEFL